MKITIIWITLGLGILLSGCNPLKSGARKYEASETIITSESNSAAFAFPALISPYSSDTSSNADISVIVELNGYPPNLYEFCDEKVRLHNYSLYFRNSLSDGAKIDITSLNPNVPAQARKTLTFSFPVGLPQDHCDRKKHTISFDDSWTFEDKKTLLIDFYNGGNSLGVITVATIVTILNDGAGGGGENGPSGQ